MNTHFFIWAARDTAARARSDARQAGFGVRGALGLAPKLNLRGSHPSSPPLCWKEKVKFPPTPPSRARPASYGAIHSPRSSLANGDGPLSLFINLPVSPSRTRSWTLSQGTGGFRGRSAAPGVRCYLL